MSETRTHHVELRFVRGYEFVATFRDKENVPALVFDEPPPLGEGAGPSAAAVLAAAVGNCLAASFAFCLRKVRLEPVDLAVNVAAHVDRNAAGPLQNHGYRRRAQSAAAGGRPLATGALRAVVRGLLHRDRERTAWHSRPREDRRPDRREGGIDRFTGASWRVAVRMFCRLFSAP